MENSSNVISTKSERGAVTSTLTLPPTLKYYDAEIVCMLTSPSGTMSASDPAYLHLQCESLRTIHVLLLFYS